MFYKAHYTVVYLVAFFVFFYTILYHCCWCYDNSDICTYTMYCMWRFTQRWYYYSDTIRYEQPFSISTAACDISSRQWHYNPSVIEAAVSDISSCQWYHQLSVISPAVINISSPSAVLIQMYVSERNVTKRYHRTLNAKTRYVTERNVTIHTGHCYKDVTDKAGT